MSDHYHHFLASVNGVGGNPGTSPQELHPSSPFPGAQLPGTGQLQTPYQNFSYFGTFTEPSLGYNQPKSQKSRKKASSNLDPVKHRRTRSGCFTCRSRRVKVCDHSPAP